MKKVFLLATTFVLLLGVSSCKSSGSFESDVRKYGNMRCKMQQLQAKDQSDEKVKKEMEDLNKEMDEYSNELEKKYKDQKNDSVMDAKADKIMKDIMANCK